MRIVFVGLILIGTLFGCGGVKPQAESVATQISGNTYIDPNTDNIHITFPFGIQSFAKPKIESINNNVIQVQTLLTDILSRTVFINTMSLSDEASSQIDHTASDISKPLFIEKKENGYCVLFLDQNFSTSTLESRVLKKYNNNRIVIIRIVEKLYEKELEAPLKKQYIGYTLNICNQVFN